MPDPAAGDGRDPEHLLRRRGALLHPGQQDVGQPQRQRLAVQPRGEQLLGVEGVALGAGDHVVDVRLRTGRLGAASPRTSAPTSASGSGASSIRSTAGQPDQLGEQRPERMPAVQVVGAVGGDDATGSSTSRASR